jgi:hypothetical protein
MHSFDAAGVARLVIAKVETVETRDTVPCRYPDIAVVIGRDIRNGITAKPLFCGIVLSDGLKGLCLCHITCEQGEGYYCCAK